VRQAFRKYLECGIFAHGFARAWGDDCGHDYFVAYSCKGRILRAFVRRGLLESCDDKRGAKVDELHLTPLELIALVPPPRTHRHRWAIRYHPRPNCATQTVEGASPVGGVDRPHL
jgi:hypothetical protein